MRTYGKTPLGLQDALKDEVEMLLDGMLFKQPKGKELVPMKVYRQLLPIPEGPAPENGEEEEEEEEDILARCPWALIRINEGGMDGIKGKQEAVVTIGFGVYDDSADNQGHRAIMSVIECIYERFAKNPILANGFTCSEEFRYALQEDTGLFPYFFGALTTEFSFSGFRRENNLI
ncbi:MAG: hypothetical protein Q4F24_08100 [Eubacteriales bacterium]|nr:hypothetical protein [Eubacteriales bacterium]